MRFRIGRGDLDAQYQRHNFLDHSCLREQWILAKSVQKYIPYIWIAMLRRFAIASGAAVNASLSSPSGPVSMPSTGGPANSSSSTGVVQSTSASLSSSEITSGMTAGGQTSTSISAAPQAPAAASGGTSTSQPTPSPAVKINCLSTVSVSSPTSLLIVQV